jgi:hypothetical protein
MKIKNEKLRKELMGKLAFQKCFPFANNIPPILMGGFGGGFGGGTNFYGPGVWNPGVGGPLWNDNIPPYSGYEGDDWGNYNGYGSPANPIQLDAVTITPVNQNSGSAWSNLGWTIAGIAEAVVGVALIPETGFAGVYLTIDGITRTGLNLANFINSIKGANVPPLPSNFGGAIGLGFSGEEGAYWGSIANDIVTALVSGLVFESAWAAAEALNESNFLLLIANGTIATSDINTIIAWFENWKIENP